MTPRMWSPCWSNWSKPRAHLWPMAPMIGAEFSTPFSQKPERQFHRSSMQGGRAWTNCRNIADPARPACPFGRRAWAHELQKASGYNMRSKVEAAISRYKRVIGDILKSRDDARRVTEVAIVVKSLNRMRDLGQAICVRVA